MSGLFCFVSAQSSIWTIVIMSSTYAPLPFSYLAAGSQAPKTTGFRKDEGLYGSRMDMAKPIPAVRHDQPRRAADWSIDHMLRGSELTSSERRPRPTSHDVTDADSVLSSNMRLPRPDVSLYQSQIDGSTFAGGGRSPSPLPTSVDTPSGHYSNRSPNDLGDDVPARAPPHYAGVGVFDNFILKGPTGVQKSVSDAGARRRNDEQRPLPRSRLEQLFDDRPSSVNVMATHRLDSADVTAETRLPRTSATSAGHHNDSTDLPADMPTADNTRTNSFTVTTRSVFNRKICRLM